MLEETSIRGTILLFIPFFFCNIKKYFVVSEYQILDTGSKLKHCIITILKINMKTPYIYSNLSTYRARFKILVYEGGKNKL